MPGPTQVLHEWFSRDPTYGLSIFVEEYYLHIWVSTRRIAIAFFLATAIGVPLGLFLGWSKRFKQYVISGFRDCCVRVPPLAWVPLAIVMFRGSETPVIFLTFLASFYATALNTMLGVESIDVSYVRAASCLGAKRWQVFRHVIVPGALPFIFTGLQISVGVAWFSLVAGEMVSGQYGLGYVINTSYTMVRYPTIIIGMVTLGIVGYVTSALVRLARRLHDAMAHARARAGRQQVSAQPLPRLALRRCQARISRCRRQRPARAACASTTSSRSTARRAPASWPSTTARSTFPPARSA